MIVTNTSIHLTSLDNDTFNIIDSQSYENISKLPLRRSKVNKVKHDLIASVSNSIIIHNVTQNTIRTYKSCEENVNPHIDSIINDLDWNPKVSNVIATCDNSGIFSIFDLKVKKPTMILNKSNKQFINTSSIKFLRFDDYNPLQVLINCIDNSKNVVKLLDLRRVDQFIYEFKNPNDIVYISKVNNSDFKYIDNKGTFYE